jgi:hypothetical protein
MSDINKILNDALENGLLNESNFIDTAKDYVKDIPGKVSDVVGDVVGDVPNKIGNIIKYRKIDPSLWDKAKGQYRFLTNPGGEALKAGLTTGGLAAVALGAGLGAVALAKKLREKKAQAKSKEKKN